MGKSSPHKFGQIIGNLLEDIVAPFLADFADEKNLYLDHQKKPRKARKGKKVAWKDSYGNTHCLDFVLEKNGAENAIGIPVAFIEVAWRRYTKHSRNKAQEIQGAILPLAEKHRWSNPFLGIVLCGVFTEGSLDQLRSLGFQILHFPYETFVEAFAKEGIDVVFDEETPDAAFQKCVRKIESATRVKIQKIKRHLAAANEDRLAEFMSSLELRLNRMVEKVVVIPLYGDSNEFSTIDDAVRFLTVHRKSNGSNGFKKYEILVAFSNDDRVEGAFEDKTKALEFLQFVSRQ